MARMIVDTQFKEELTVKPGTLMIHREPPAFVVMATSIVVGDEFAGVALEDGAYGEQWIIDQYKPFEGKLTLEQ